MLSSSSVLSPALRRFGAAAATLCVVAATFPLTSLQPVQAAPSGGDSAALAVDPAYRPSADIGFHDHTRDGSDRTVRNDLSGDLGGMVEFAQATTVSPTGNAENEAPDLTAERMALLLFTPTSEITGGTVEVSIDGEVMGTLDLDAPSRIPAADQDFDEDRGTVAYSLRAWSAKLPAQWVRPGLTLTFTDAEGRAGKLGQVDMGSPDEMVINNIRLGMLTEAPAEDAQPFLTDPISSGTDYFQTVPVSKLTVAQYEDVELDEVIVASGDIYTKDSPDPSEGSVYAGTMRENVGKAQVSTGINLATWGLTSSEMTQKQPGSTNQRVIHHSAGLYSNGVHKHGLSGGNGMATLYSSKGNELSHELGHSYGIGHYPGADDTATGDDKIRNASHHMDSGWGYIGYRDLMRSNLDLREYRDDVQILDFTFHENLAGKYNFNTDAMAGGWDASPVSEYTLHTGYTLKRIQEYLTDLTADTQYPSGYRAWDAENGWVDAATLDPEFDLRKPKEVGVPVFTILGGYNPADADQTVVYPAFRSNYGVTFDLPQVDASAQAEERACWLEVDFAEGGTQHIELDASDGVKQLNVNISEAEKPTGAQVQCRTGDTTTALGDPIEIDTDLEPMSKPAVIGGDQGFDQLRSKELSELEPKLAEQAGSGTPVLGAEDLQILTGWADDLSALSTEAREVADRILTLQQDAADFEAYLAQHAPEGEKADEEKLGELAWFLGERGYLDDSGQVLPAGSPVTVDEGKCLYGEGTGIRADDDVENCAANHEDTFFVDKIDRIHPTDQPGLCLQAASPVTLKPCSQADIDQRWTLKDDGHVVRAGDAESALDLNRREGTLGLYGVQDSSNQLFEGFETSDNALLAYLSSECLTTLGTLGDLPPAVAPPASAEGVAGAGGNASVTDAVAAGTENPAEAAAEEAEGAEPEDAPAEGAAPSEAAATEDAGSEDATPAGASAAPEESATAQDEGSFLARTGTDLALPLGIAVAVLALSGGLLLAVRHRRSKR